MKTDLFQSCGHCWVFQICWHIECSTFTASSFRIWNSSTGIPSPPVVDGEPQMKLHLFTHHSPPIVPNRPRIDTGPCGLGIGDPCPMWIEVLWKTPLYLYVPHNYAWENHNLISNVIHFPTVLEQFWYGIFKTEQWTQFSILVKSTPNLFYYYDCSIGVHTWWLRW